MDFPESSVMPSESISRASRISTTVRHISEHQIESTSSGFFEIFFLIFDEIGKFSPPNSFLIFIQIFISFYQFYITSFFPFMSDGWDFSVFPDKIIRYLNYPVDFGNGDPDIFNSGICLCLLLILCAIFIIFLIIIFFYYKANKMFPQHCALATRIIISIVIPIILSPLSYIIVFSFKSCFTNDSSYIPCINKTEYNKTKIYDDPSGNLSEISTTNRQLYLTTATIGILFYFFLLFIFYADVMFRSSTPYLEDTPLSMWDGFPLFLSMFGSTLNIIFSGFIFRFPTWAAYFLIICYLIYNGYILYNILFFPMIKHWMNATFFIFVSSSLFSSLFQLFPIKSIYRLLIPLVIFVVHIPIVIIFLRQFRRKITRQEIEEANISTESRALRYLRLSISDRCADFVLFKWLKPMNQKSTNKLLFQMAQFISFFPSESQNLTFYISLLARRNNISLHQQFLFFQLRRVHIFRQSSTSKQLNEDLSTISKATSQCISSFAQFLIRTIDDRQELTIDSLRSLAKLNKSTCSMCHEAMSRYPNNSRLIFIFSRYIIECQADFKGGVSMYQEAQMIERGKRATIDYAFRSMINLFPTYLWKHILDYKGRNILKRRTRQKSGSSLSADSMTNDKNNPMSETDIESNEKVASNVLENPKLRFALRKAVNNMKSKGIMIMTFSCVVRFILTFVICMIIMGVAPSIIGERKVNYQNIAEIGTVRKCIDLSLFRMSKIWSRNLNLSPTQEDIRSALGPDISVDEFDNSTIEPEIAMISDVFSSIEAIERLGKLLIEVKYQDSMSSSDKDSNFILFNNISFCNRAKGKFYESTTSLRYFMLYLLNQIVSVTRLDSLYDDPFDWKEDECICEVVMNMGKIIQVLNDQSSVLISREQEYSNTMNTKILIFFCIVIPFIFAAFIIPYFVGYAKMISEFRQIFDVLNLLPIQIYKESCMPIARFNADYEQVQEAVSQVDYSGCQKIEMAIPGILCSVLVAGSLIGTFFLLRDVNNKFYALVKWLEIGSHRAPLLIETITNAIFAGIFGYVGATDYTSHVYHLDLVYNYSQRFLYQHKDLIWGSDSSTSCNNFTERLDQLHFTNTCFIDYKSESLQADYRCFSLDQQIMTFNKFAKDIYLSIIYAQHNSNMTTNSSNKKSDFDIAFINILNSYEAINLHYLGITFLLPKLEEAQQILNQGINLKIDQLKKYSIAISLGTFATDIIIFIIELAILTTLREEYNIVRILIARLPPLGVVQNQSLVELMTGNIEGVKSKQNSPIINHIIYCSNPIIVFDKTCKIQMVNSQTTKTFGISKEQLFHTHISTVISKDDCSLIHSKVNQNIEYNKNSIFSHSNDKDEFVRISSRESDNNEENISILEPLMKSNENIDLNNNNNNNNNDQGTSEKVDLYNDPIEMTIIGIKDDGNKIILSAILAYLPEPDDVYALIMRNDTKVYINEEEIKRAKLKTTEIMTQVLPQAIAESENIKENISFSIKLVTVVTIKILNFNDSISHFTSVQAIRNMSELYTIYDTQLMNYPNLTKTSVISEYFQAVGGLFNNNYIQRDSANQLQEIEGENNQENKEQNNQENKEQNNQENENDKQNNLGLNESNDSTFFDSNNNFNNFNNDKIEGNNINNLIISASNIDAFNHYNESINRHNADGVNNSILIQSSSIESINGNFNRANINNGIDINNMGANNGGVNNINNNDVNNLSNGGKNTNDDDDASIIRPRSHSKIRFVRSRQSLYDISNLKCGQNDQFANIVLDSIYFAFNCIDATEYTNNATGSNYVIGIGINAGGPITAGTFGEEHIKFEVLGEAIKSSFKVVDASEAGMIIITEEAFEFLKDSPEARKNLIFEEYKCLDMLHMKKVKSYIVKPSKELIPYQDQDEDLIEGMQNEHQTNELPQD